MRAAAPSALSAGLARSAVMSGGAPPTPTAAAGPPTPTAAPGGAAGIWAHAAGVRPADSAKPAQYFFHVFMGPLPLSCLVGGYEPSCRGRRPVPYAGKFVVLD